MFHPFLCFAFTDSGNSRMISLILLANETRPLRLKQKNFEKIDLGVRALQETCLRSGINKVGLPDLIIAQQAIRLGIPLFSLDRHFTLMSKHVSLALWPGPQK